MQIWYVPTIIVRMEISWNTRESYKDRFNQGDRIKHWKPLMGAKRYIIIKMKRRIWWCNNGIRNKLRIQSPSHRKMLNSHNRVKDYVKLTTNNTDIFYIFYIIQIIFFKLQILFLSKNDFSIAAEILMNWKNFFY